MRTLTETHVYMQGHQGEKVEHFDVSNVIYHKFSHGAVSYTLNGENVNVMLESAIIPKETFTYCFPSNFESEILINITPVTQSQPTQLKTTNAVKINRRE